MHMQVNGMFALDNSLRKQPARSQLLFSSVSSIVAPTGQPNYAAANAILNAHANAKAQQVSRNPSFLSLIISLTTADFEEILLRA